MSFVGIGKEKFTMRIRDLENVLRHRRIPYPKRSVEFIALIAISCTLFLFLHTKNLNSRLKEMEVKLQPSEFSALGLTGDNHIDDSKHHHDRNTLHGTYQYLKSTGQLDSLSSIDLNNTAKSRKNLLFFNRLQKVGSGSFMELLVDLGKTNEFENFRHTPQANRGHFLNLKQEKQLATKLSRFTKDMVYCEHTAFINFTEFHFPNPIYINMVRDPIERVISGFYYVRNPQIYASTLERRPMTPKKPDEWFDLDFNVCVRRNYMECSYKSNRIPADNAHPHYERLASMFCGNDKACLYFNSREVVQRAKYNVESLYAVVGSWEDTNVTLSVLEAYIPKFFRGARGIYHLFEEKYKIVNNNKSMKKPVADDVREILKTKFNHEIDFYNFCKQRLYKQYLAINKHIYS